MSRVLPSKEKIIIRHGQLKAKIRCFNCDEMEHFAIECRNQRKGRKDTSYAELEAKYEVLLKKHHGRAYIAEGKNWDDSYGEEPEILENLILMAISN